MRGRLRGVWGNDGVGLTAPTPSLPHTPDVIPAHSDVIPAKAGICGNDVDTGNDGDRIDRTPLPRHSQPHNRDGFPPSRE